MTAVEWFFRWVNDNPEATYKEYAKAFEKAKEMEKQQIKDAFLDGNKIMVNLETYVSKRSDENFKQFSLYEHKETITSADTITSSQTEISDDEIYKEAEHKSKIFRGWTTYETSAFIMACQWYREQLRKGSSNSQNI